MLTSYSNHIGNATTKSVKASVVGVIIAEITSITTTACLRQVFIIWALTKPIRPKSQLTTGSSKTMPITRLIISSVSIYDCNVNMFATSSLTWYVPRNFTVNGKIRK